jgi:hypothetical protein
LSIAFGCPTGDVTRVAIRDLDLWVRYLLLQLEPAGMSARFPGLPAFSPGSPPGLGRQSELARVGRPSDLATPKLTISSVAYHQLGAYCELCIEAELGELDDEAHELQIFRAAIEVTGSEILV